MIIERYAVFSKRSLYTFIMNFLSWICETPKYSLENKKIVCQKRKYFEICPPILLFRYREARTPPKTIYKSKWFIASKIGSSSRNFRNSHVSRRTSAFARGEHKDVFVPIPTTPIHSILLGTFLISMSRQIRRFLVVCIWYIT